MSLIKDFRKSMDEVAAKKVTKTDVLKNAYVPDEHQKILLANAGFTPVLKSDTRRLQIIDGDSGRTLFASYYNAMRKDGRLPEARMGREFARWLAIGEMLYLGRKETWLYAIVITNRGSNFEESVDDVEDSSLAGLGLTELAARVRTLEGQPAKRLRLSAVIERNPVVRALAILRSQGHCEMPDCRVEGFVKVDGSRYLEVHHIHQLCLGGDDAIANVAALCATCHARVHYSVDAVSLETSLKKAVLDANKRHNLA